MQPADIILDAMNKFEQRWVSILFDVFPDLLCILFQELAVQSTTELVLTERSAYLGIGRPPSTILVIAAPVPIVGCHLAILIPELISSPEHPRV